MVTLCLSITTPHASIDSIALDQSDITIKPADGPLQLQATTEPTFPGQQLTWLTSNAAVATVSSDGLITAHKGGRAVITVESDGLSAACQVTVIPDIPSLSKTPSRYDLRDIVDMTPVKEQGDTGGCWAFASIAALETSHLYKTGIPLNLSENHLMTQLSTAYDESYNRSSANGGDDLMAVGYYAGWRGPVSEEADPFPQSLNGADMVINNGLKPLGYVQEAIFLPERKHALDNYNIKQAILEHGAVAAAMWKGSAQTFGPYYNENTFAWYYNLPHMNKEGNGHAVTIIGWDDSFPKESFAITPTRL